MALSKVDYNSLNVTAAASKALKWNSAADGFETGDVAGALVLLETQTASSSATLSFTSGIDSTYDKYVFKFYDIHPATDNEYLTFNGSSDTGSNYNATKTSATFEVYHLENDESAIGYKGSADLAQSTDFQKITSNIGNGNDESAVGTLTLFNPSSTTFVKHFILRLCHYLPNDAESDYYGQGYFNTTSVIDAVQFKMSSGNIDAGVIKMYGVA